MEITNSQMADYLYQKVLNRPLMWALLLFLGTLSIAGVRAESEPLSTLLCDGVPLGVSKEMKSDSTRFVSGSRLQFLTDGSIASTTAITDLETCEDNYCLHHFMYKDSEMDECKYVFSTFANRDAVFGSSIVTNGNDQISDYRQCAIIFKNQCYREIE